ncbi:type IV secretory system conjugative DNA transfer family protein [Streptomyces sp. NPDC053755]|uniref:type IV secretory system conjugative DNA transfer family protein n=1 Tax=Streptomyces sp. NPDC053755 TaxID=3155815 RepID=UPI00342518FA
MAQDQRTGGVSDGLLVGLLGFLFGLSVLAWTATGLAGLLAKGAWPTGVTFTRTPFALRALIGSPQDLAGAWPDTPAGELSGYGLFWGLFIGELMVLAVLLVFAVGTLARWRGVRAARRARAGGAAVEAREEHRRHPSQASPATTEPVVSEPLHTEANEANNTAESTAPAEPVAHKAVVVEPVIVEPVIVEPVPPAKPLRAEATEATETTEPEPASAAIALAQAAPTGPFLIDPVLPSPRAPRLVYGSPAARRPSALQAVQDAEGPALVVTSDPSVWAETKDARGKLGPVLVYDPGHLCDTPARLHWSPADRCEDPATAQERSIALLAPVRPPSRLDAAVAETAETLLRCWLHAAAVGDRPFKQIHRWAQGTGAHEPVRILRTHPKAAGGHAGLLESALTAYPERRQMAQELTARALSSLSSVHIREACTPNRTDSLTLESFIAEGGTLYVVGEPVEDPRTRPGAMPLLTALTASVVGHGRRMAARSSDGRLDPPLTLVLDDVAAVAPIPRLPDLLAHGQDKGLPTTVLLRSREQARARWQQPLPQS